MSTPAFNPAPPNPSLVIREIKNTNLLIFSVPFSRFGLVRVGGRSTAIKLSDGSVALLASHPLCRESYDSIAKFGNPVKTIILGDLEHTMYASQYAAAYPSATIYSPASTIERLEKNPVLKGRISSDFKRIDSESNGEILTHDFKDSFKNEDVAILAVKSKTLIQADLLFNLPATEQYSKTTSSAAMPFLSSFSAGSKVHQSALWYALVTNKTQMTRDAKVVASWDFDRIIPCHGDVIETGGKKLWEKTYDWFINGKP